MIRNFVSLLIIIGLTLAFLFFWDSSPEELLGSAVPKDTKIQQHPSNIIINHISHHYDEAGKLNYLLNAEEVRHFQINSKRPSNKDHTDISQPEIILYRDNAPPWHIRSDSGQSTEQGSVITMIGNVIAWQTDAAGFKSELTTTKLVVMPDKQYAETDKPVMLKAPDSTTKAIGMQAFLQQDKIKLLSRVRGLYEAP